MNARNRRRQIKHDDFSVPSMPLSEADEALFGAIAAADSQLATIGDDGRIQIGVFTMTTTGLVAGGQATFEEWERVGDVLRRLDASIQWLIGDWFAYGERVWGQTYEQISDTTGYEVKTLYDYAYVAKSVDFSVRTENLTFGHHKLVAGLEPDEQRRWLKYAVDHQLSISQMRQAMALTPPTLSAQSEGWSALFSPEIKRAINKLFSLGRKVGQGDRRAADNLLSQIEQHRRWLDEIERFVRDQS
jgi:hypothetical protein